MEYIINGSFKELATLIKCFNGLQGVFIDSIEPNDLQSYTMIVELYKSIDSLMGEIKDYAEFEGIPVPSISIKRKEN